MPFRHAALLVVVHACVLVFCTVRARQLRGALAADAEEQTDGAGDGDSSSNSSDDAPLYDIASQTKASDESEAKDAAHGNSEV